MCKKVLLTWRAAQLIDFSQVKKVISAQSMYAHIIMFNTTHASHCAGAVYIVQQSDIILLL